MLDGTWGNKERGIDALGGQRGNEQTTGFRHINQVDVISNVGNRGSGLFMRKVEESEVDSKLTFMREHICKLSVPM